GEQVGDRAALSFLPAALWPAALSARGVERRTGPTASFITRVRAFAAQLARRPLRVALFAPALAIFALAVRGAIQLLQLLVGEWTVELLAQRVQRLRSRR